MRNIFIDPPSEAYYKNRLFDGANVILNRDDTLAPSIRLRNAAHQQGMTVQTADYLPAENTVDPLDYYSFGIVKNYPYLQRRSNIRMKAFVIMEPPVVSPNLYSAIPELTRIFERVYVHNIDGDGYSLERVNASRLRKLYWPQPRREVIYEIWSNSNRINRIVVINGNHKPISRHREQYSKRIDVMVELANSNAVDLYGRDWNKPWSRKSLWFPYWLNRSALMSIYRGSCDSKYSTLGKYNFCLCFENMAMNGYITEKIFDCFYAGTIPIYLGAADIDKYIPKSTYIDFRDFNNVSELLLYIHSLSAKKIDDIRENGKIYIQSEGYQMYYRSLDSIIYDS